ncbi:MAG TPA: glycerophosphoryl diester phosphodiesterase membrane domain-containing protein, partial [Gemmatimonadaceae bacterium]|nr:glycerophosphoryl diester phosphodiesterase membrane domain-containing protein [Gemmatimonadaceae bacterium]
MASPLPLRPRSATEIVDAAFQLYRRDPMSYLLVSALCYAPVLVLQLVTQGATAQLTPESIQASWPKALMVAIGYWISLAFMSAVIVRLCSEDYFGRRLDPATAVQEAVRRLPAVMLGILLKYTLMIVGFLLFIVGIFYVIARYFAVTPCIVLENRGVFGAFGRSAVLSRGQKLHILFTSFLALVIFLVLYFAVIILAAT